MTLEEFSKISDALGNPHRVRIVGYLACGSMCGCDLLQYFPFTQPTLSNHLKVLRESGIVLAEPQGKWTHFRLDQALLADWRRCAARLAAGDPDGECYEDRAAREEDFPASAPVTMKLQEA